jgi:hypothetical protein
MNFATLALALAAASGAGAAATKKLLEPLPMSDVALEGEWKEAERRNQEVWGSSLHMSFVCTTTY